jgi:glycosyltransferase involved in cell wall biosynthesis
MPNPLKKLARKGLKTVGETAANIERLAASRTPQPVEWPFNIRDLVDVHYVNLQVGALFETRTEAMERVLVTRPRHAITIHPLIEPTWMMGGIPRNVRDWFDALRRPGSVTALGPLFSLARAGGRPDDKPLDVLRRFLATATDDTVLPAVDEDFVLTWGEAKEILEHRARVFSAHNLRTHRRAYGVWDDEAEKAFRDGLTLISEPTGSAGPLITIVMPVHNRQHVVTRAIESVRAQTFGSWELVVVDDGSTDATRDVVSAIAETDPRVKLVAQPKSGVSAARNAGIREGNGPVVAFIDSDNAWRHDFLHVSVSALRQYGVPVTYAGIKRYENDGAVKYVGLQAGRDYLLDGLSFIDLNVLVVQRSLLDEVGLFDESLRRWVDYDLILRLLLDHPAKYLPVIGVDYDHEDNGVGRITTSERSTWRDVVLSKYLLDPAAEPARVAGRVSVLLHTRNNWQATVACIRSVLSEADTDGLDVEVVLIDNASTRDFTAILASVFAKEPRLIMRREANDRRPALSYDLAFLESTGEFTLFLSASTVGSRGWLGSLVRELTAEVTGAHGVVLDAEGTVGAGGFVFAGRRILPRAFLRGNPLEDLRRSGLTRFAAASTRCLLVRSADVERLGGLRPDFGDSLFDVDFCLRLTGGERSIALAGECVLYDSTLPDDRLTGIDAEASNALVEFWGDRLPIEDPTADYARAGFEQIGWSVDNQVGVIAPHRSLVTFSSLHAGIPELNRRAGAARRWAIKISTPSEARGDSWGDTFFADDLRHALEEQGQEVVVDRVSAHFRRTRGLDDVVVTIRGLARVAPQPGAINILWVISHPDLVSDAEIASFDLVYAAGIEWARRATVRTGIEVRPLLQATNPARFHPNLSNPDSGDAVVFVGTPRKAMRPIVEHAIAAGHSPAIYGHGWEGYVDRKLVRAEFVGPADVGALYRSSGVVLNDHWADMAELGFLSNRLFDAAAAGARVVSDVVPGLDDVFRGVVRSYRSIDELGALLADPSAWAAPNEILLLSEEVRQHHSFAARARTLVDAVATFENTPSRGSAVRPC